MGNIMGNVPGYGLTDIQKTELKVLEEKEKRTEKQEITLKDLIEKRDNKPDFNLSDTAKTYVKGIVKRMVFDYIIDIESRPMTKGITVEGKSIELYNEVYFTDYVKNEIRLSNNFITGECDVDTGKKIIDVKSSWSKETFIATPDEIDNKDYEWQLRGYMWLYGRDESEVAYCLVDTPDSLLEWENNLTIHHVEDIAPELRVTIKTFKRDLELETQIMEKVRECRKYAVWYEKQILNK